MRRTLCIPVFLLLLLGCGKIPSAPNQSISTPAVTLLEAIFNTVQTESSVSATGAVHQQPIQGSAVVADLETQYLAARDLYNKLLVLNKLPELPAPEALAMLARLFEQEEDPNFGQNCCIRSWTSRERCSLSLACWHSLSNPINHIAFASPLLIYWWNLTMKRELRSYKTSSPIPNLKFAKPSMAPSN